MRFEQNPKNPEDIAYWDETNKVWKRAEKTDANPKTGELAAWVENAWHRTGRVSQPKATGVKAVGKAWQAGSLEAGLAGIKAYQAIGNPLDAAAKALGLRAPMPSIAPTPLTSAERPLASSEVAPTWLEAMQQKVAQPNLSTPTMQATREVQLTKGIAQRKAEDAAENKKDTEAAVKRYNSTKDIADFYEKEIEQIKSKYKENDITQMVESLPLSVGGMIASRVPVVGTGAQAYVFGGSAAQDFINKGFAEDRQKPENKKYSDDELRARTIDKYKLFAALSGGVQAGGQIIGNKLLTKVIPQNLPIKNKLVKMIASMFAGGVSEGVEEGPFQEGGTILAEKAAGLQTGPVGERIWQAGKIGAMSGLLLGGGGYALNSVLSPKTKVAIDKAKKNPTPENKNKAEKAIVEDYKAATPEQKQELNKGLTPEQKKLIDDLIAEKESLAAERDAVVAKNVQLEADVVTDPLTGIKNRRGLEQVKEGKTQSIIFDIDHFKKINDTHGHPVGDVVLQDVANRGQKIADKYGGEISKIGGEEFVVLLPEGADRARVSEEIRQSMAETPAVAFGKEVPFTVSVGHAKMDVSGDPWKTADKYMYEAKNSGRNKVMGEPTTEKAPEVAINKQLTKESKIDIMLTEDKNEQRDTQPTAGGLPGDGETGSATRKDSGTPARSILPVAFQPRDDGRAGGVESVKVVNATEADASVLIGNLTKGVSNHKYKHQVTIPTQKDLVGSTIISTGDGLGGLSVKKNGEIAHFFNVGKPENAIVALKDGIKSGGKWLNAFDTRLTGIYGRQGFRPIAKIKFVEEYAPKGWDYNNYKEWDNGRPDVVFMVYDGKNRSYSETKRLVKDLTYSEDYASAEKILVPAPPAKAKTDREVQAERGQTEITETADEQITATEEVKPEMVESQLSKRLQNLAVKDNLLGKYVDELGNEYQKTFGALPEHEKMNMKEQAQKNIKLINSDPGLAYQIATGEKTVTGYRQDTMYAALVNRAFAQGDAEIIQDLASDPNFTGETTKSGQWLRSLAEIQPENPIRAIADLKKTREEVQAKRGKDKKTIKEAKIKDRTAVENNLKSDSFTESGRVSSKKRTWADFLEKIKC